MYCYTKDTHSSLCWNSRRIAVKYCVTKVLITFVFVITLYITWMFRNFARLLPLVARSTVIVLSQQIGSKISKCWLEQKGSSKMRASGHRASLSSSMFEEINNIYHTKVSNYRWTYKLNWFIFKMFSLLDTDRFIISKHSKYTERINHCQANAWIQRQGVRFAVVIQVEDDLCKANYFKCIR